MWKDLDIWLLLAGLGIFLFGIRLIEDSIAKLGGRDLKRLLRGHTSTRLRAILTGTVATALLQSSTAVTLMVMAFTGAGIITLESGIGVVLGANIGTTGTSWIVASIGFKLDIARFALPFIGIGGLVLVFLGRSPRYAQVSHLLVGFGFLFLGLDQMKDSVSAFAEGFDAARFAGSPWWAFVLLGVGLTAVMQSSTVTVAIMLTAVHGGLFEFREAALAVVGCSLGTTSTAFLSALSAAAVKKRVAWTNLVFNLFSSGLAIAMLPLYLRLLSAVLGEGFDAVTGIALFYTLFNVAGVLAFLPLIGHFGRLVERLAPERAERRTRYIGGIAPDVPEAAVAGVRKEVRGLLLRTIDLHLELFGLGRAGLLPPDEALPPRTRYTGHQERYTELKLLQAEIITFVARVEQHELPVGETGELGRATHAAHLALYAAKTLKDVKANIDAFAGDGGLLDRFHQRSCARIAGSHGELAALLAPDGVPDAPARIEALLRRMAEEDARGLRELSDAARDGTLKELDLGTALQVHRAIAQSGHDLAMAVAGMVAPSIQVGNGVEAVREEQPEGTKG